jgi:site-specific DNA-methyltransferase (adenine-specific)
MSFLAEIYEGEGSRMRHVADQEVGLIMTCPPYYPEELEETLRLPVSKQLQVESVASTILEYQKSLWPVLKECARVIKPGGILCMVSSDIRFGGVLMGVTSMLRQGAEMNGFQLFSRVHMRVISYQRRIKSQKGRPFRADDTSVVEVYSMGEPEMSGARGEFTPQELKSMSNPFWTISSVGKKRIHPHQLSGSVISKLVRLYSKKGDLVVDPFAGSGSTIVEASLCGRRALGYEKDPIRASKAMEHVSRKIRRVR